MSTWTVIGRVAGEANRLTVEEGATRDAAIQAFCKRAAARTGRKPGKLEFYVDYVFAGRLEPVATARYVPAAPVLQPA
jgi:hypothetical protein